MNIGKSLDRIIELFRIFRNEVEDNNKAGFFDINHLSEDVLVPVLRDVFNCQFLRNLNKETKNYPGIDLADAHARIAFQVTSDNSLDKVVDALTKVISHQSYLLYDTIYIYILKNKQKSYSKTKLQALTKPFFEFDPDKHILDSHDLVNKIRTLEYPIIQRIEQTLEVHFSNPSKYFVPNQIVAKTEKLLLNILPITIPAELFIAQKNYDRDEIIENDRKLNTDDGEKKRRFRLSYRSSERAIVWAALKQNGQIFTSDWVVRGKEIFSFHNLRDENLGISKIIDTASADPISVETYIKNSDGSFNLDHLSIFRDLLRKTFQAQLRHRGIKWQHDERIFIFCNLNEQESEKIQIRKETWSKGRKGGRMVFQEVRNEHDTSKVLNYEHLAFEVNFDIYDNQWYLAIKPTLFYSWNGYAKSKWHKPNISIVKKKDRNHNVLEDLMFITEILQKDQLEELLNQEESLFIKLGKLVEIGDAPFLDDNEWLQHEEKRKRKALSKSPDMPLFTK